MPAGFAVRQVMEHTVSLRFVMGEYSFRCGRRTPPSSRCYPRRRRGRTMIDRRQVAREAYEFYTKASMTGRPTGPGSPLYSFFADASGVQHFFEPSHRHVVYVKLAHPEHVTRLFRPPGGPPYAFTSEDRYIEILPPLMAFSRFQEAVLQPARYSYAAVFDMASPSWVTPVSEWPPS